MEGTLLSKWWRGRRKLKWDFYQGQNASVGGKSENYEQKKIFLYHILQVALDDKKATQKEIDTVAILLALQKSKQAKSKPRRQPAKKVTKDKILVIELNIIRINIHAHRKHVGYRTYINEPHTCKISPKDSA